MRDMTCELGPVPAIPSLQSFTLPARCSLLLCAAVVHAATLMQLPIKVLLLQGFVESDRWFDVAVKVAREFMKAHIISSDSDRIAVVFYGSVRPICHYTLKGTAQPPAC